MRIVFVLIVMSISIWGFSTAASADTATFVTPVNGNPGTVANGADGTGVLVAPGESIGLLLNTPFALFDSDGFTPINNNVSIFALSSAGSAVATLGFGRYNNGAPTIFHRQNFQAQSGGSSVDFAFLAFVGCGAAGGCDFIEISAVDGFSGSTGFILDAVTFSGVALMSVTAPAPEPGTWALMIIGFVLIALRLKYGRRKIHQTIPPVMMHSGLAPAHG